MTTLSLFTIEACTRHPDRMTPESLVSAMCKNIWDIWMHAWYQKCFQGSDGVGFGMAQSDNSVGRGRGSNDNFGNFTMFYSGRQFGPPF